MVDVKIYTTRVCPYCVSAKSLFKGLGVAFEEIGLDADPGLRARLSAENGGWRSVPMIFVGGKFLGGFDDVNALHKAGKLMPMVKGEA
jgi:glutaredoxin 3